MPSRHRFLLIAFSYLASIHLFHLAVRYRYLNHEASWQPRGSRTYPVSDHIASDGEEWFADQQGGDGDPVVDQPLICVGIDTFARRGDDYLPATLGGLLSPLKPEQRSLIHVVVRFKGDRDEYGQEKHPSYHHTLAPGIVDQISHGFQGSSLSDLRGNDVDANWWLIYHRAASLPYPERHHAEGTVDYSHLLSICAATSAPWVIILEDGVVAHPRWFERITRDVIPRLEEKPAQGSQWMSVHLTYPSALRGVGENVHPRYCPSRQYDIHRHHHHPHLATT